MTQSVSPIIRTLLEDRVVAVVRLSSQEDGVPVSQALVSGGIRVIEVTITTPGALDLIRTVRERVPDAIVGAGSVLTIEDADGCLEAGAEFLVGPVFDPGLLQHVGRRGAVLCPGTFTPSEAYAAWRLGAPLIKVFPAARVGPKFLSDLKAPMPFLRLRPTGGISAETVGSFLNAGADVVGAGSWLTPKDAIAAGDFDRITERAAALRAAVRDAEAGG